MFVTLVFFFLGLFVLLLLSAFRLFRLFLLLPLLVFFSVLGFDLIGLVLFVSALAFGVFGFTVIGYGVLMSRLHLGCLCRLQQAGLDWICVGKNK